MLLILGNSLCAQTLSVEDIIRTAVAANYRVLVAANSEEAAKALHHPGMAGMLPSLSLQGNASISSNNINQEFSSGLTVNQSGVRSDNLGAQAVLRWTLFDGLSMFRQYAMSGNRAEAANIALKSEVETLIFEIYQLYYQLNAAEAQRSADSLNRELALERLELYQQKAQLGAGTRQEVIQAQLDANTFRALQNQRQAEIFNLRSQLNALMQKPADFTFTTVQEQILPPLPDLQSLKQKFRELNLDIRQAQISSEFARLDRQNLQGQYMPRIELQANYNFTHAQSSAGFSLYNQSLGPVVGITATQPLFAGLQTRTRVKVARIQERNAELQIDGITLQAEALLTGAWFRADEAYRNYELELQNHELAEENVRLAMESFKLGKISGLALREAQKTLHDAAIRKAEAAKQARIFRLQLLKIAGDLLK